MRRHQVAAKPQMQLQAQIRSKLRPINHHTADVIYNISQPPTTLQMLCNHGASFLKFPRLRKFLVFPRFHNDTISRHHEHLRILPSECPGVEEDLGLPSHQHRRAT